MYPIEPLIITGKPFRLGFILSSSVIKAGRNRKEMIKFALLILLYLNLNAFTQSNGEEYLLVKLEATGNEGGNAGKSPKSTVNRNLAGKNAKDGGKGGNVQGDYYRVSLSKLNLLQDFKVKPISIHTSLKVILLAIFFGGVRFCCCYKYLMVATPLFRKAYFVRQV